MREISHRSPVRGVSTILRAGLFILASPRQGVMGGRYLTVCLFRKTSWVALLTPGYRIDGEGLWSGQIKRPRAAHTPINPPSCAAQRLGQRQGR